MSNVASMYLQQKASKITKVTIRPVDGNADADSRKFEKAIVLSFCAVLRMLNYSGRRAPFRPALTISYDVLRFPQWGEDHDIQSSRTGGISREREESTELHEWATTNPSLSRRSGGVSGIQARKSEEHGPRSCGPHSLSRCKYSVDRGRDKRKVGNHPRLRACSFLGAR